MKPFLYATALLIFLAAHSWAQSTPPEAVAQSVQRAEVEQHLRFLAADELRGRDTGSPELEIAARYLAEQFRRYGLDTVPDALGYFQPVKLVSAQPPAEATLTYGDQSFQIGTDLLVLSGDSVDVEAPVVYANYGTADDLDAADVEGKIVITKAGGDGVTNPQSFFYMTNEKQDRVTARGGVALVELYRSNQIPWTLLVQYLNAERLTVDADLDTASQKLPVLWLNDPKGERLTRFEGGKTKSATLSVAKKEEADVPVKNVVAMVEGTDPQLKNEYVVLSAHYDHIGVAASPNPQDSIFNGARDNALGTTALLSAAEYLAAHPPKRSVLFVALTAEEKGLLGSAWYVAHPLVPLKQTVFNLNTDGAGYNDTTKVTAIGLERTTAEQSITEASKAFGLEAIQDPVPEQNLYDRSDNVSFAQKGIPAVNFAPGTTAFDAEIMKNYHQVSDEAETLNFNYAEKYAEAFTLTAERIANLPEKPFWKAGDKYEAAGEKLYGTNK
ncbi:MAG: M28 family peptidase [Tunicatimonas sp.]